GVAMQRALREIRRARFEVREHRAFPTLLEAQPQEAALADRAALHLRRFVLERRELRPRQDVAARCLRRQWHPLDRAHHTARRAGGGRSNSRSLRINSTRAGMPSPVLQLVNRNGLSPRIMRESRSITSRLAPTWEARSVLLITRMSDCEMPGPFLRGILSPAATSI